VKTALVAGAAIVVVLAGGYLIYTYWSRTTEPCDLSHYTEATRDALLPAKDFIDPAVERVVYIDQGWKPAESMEFYTRTQGSRLLPYSWFIALEQTDNERPFSDPESMNRFRCLLQKKNACNPDGLPVGFAKDPKRRGGEVDWIGLNCSACHTNEIHYKGTAYRIDGAPTLTDMNLFLESLAKALRVTLSDGEKLARFTKKVLPGGASDDDRTKLKTQLGQVTEFREQYNLRNRAPHDDGFARLDAFGRIMNEVMVRHLKLPETDGQSKPPDAPVSYPFLWDTPHHDFVQWNAVAANRVAGSPVIGSLSRNVGEVLGVFGEVEIPPVGQENSVLPGYDSSVRIGDLKALEEQLKKLQSPLWPNDFPPIDQGKRAAGEILFGEFCKRCHESINRTDPNRTVKAVKTPLKRIGTDPRMATNFSTRQGKTGPLQGRKRFFLFGDRFEDRAPGDDILVHVVLGVMVKVDNNYKESDLLSLRAVSAAGLDVYKGRPLNGIWATAPYLHNGSVPNLWELLKPGKDRVTTFSVGSREFDPVNVGFRSDPALTETFVFRTVDAEGKPIPGNGNFGHEYGTGRPVAEGGDGKRELSETERWALVEYLKSL
jgi:hypothetical protein